MSEIIGPGFQANMAYVEEMFARYQANPNSVEPEWRAYFQGFNEGFDVASQIANNAPAFENVLIQLSHGAGAATPYATTSQTSTSNSADLQFEIKVASLVQSYKQFGHLKAKLDPLGRPRKPAAVLSLETHGLSESDLNKVTNAATSVGIGSQPLSSVIAHLEKIYCGTVGIEINHISNLEERTWLESNLSRIYSPVDNETRESLFSELARADALEKTIATKYIGKKRFSIEGADAQIPAIESFIQRASELGAKEFSLAMAHRGRLTILVQVVKKPVQQLFAEFEGYPNLEVSGDLDVKYHGGYDSERTTRSGKPIHISLSFNPSHLEFVDCVVVGESRAKQMRYYNGDKSTVVPVVLHGDAAVAGQGVVYETVQMMKLRGYDVGGTIHIVANNQVGFTTNPYDARSSEYCTDVAKVVNSPVFHVNADDIDALHNVMCIAAEYRQKFLKDFFVDLICFRRHGHNETDEPNFTQPVMYKLIKEKPAPWESYSRKLAEQAPQQFQVENLKKVFDEAKASMNAAFDQVKKDRIKIELRKKQRAWEKIRLGSESDMLAATNTKVEISKLKELAQVLVQLPEGFHPHPKIAGQIVIAPRKEMAEGKRPIDWGMAELMAYATLLNEGKSVRISGQDVGRGTFSHRHAAIIDTETDQRFYPVAQAVTGEASFEAIDSFLSETAAMGFEYGYAARHENALVIWEAQFGDFNNGAQVIIDQFIVSGETKWSQPQGLVLLLPHGFEGMGPEHSSARVERYLQMAAQGNMQVCYLTSASNLFHAFRRQVVRDFRKPLVIMTPKSFIRNPRVFTSFEELANGQFEEFLDDNAKDSKKVSRVVFCTGKLAVELMDTADKKEFAKENAETAFVRIEQIYPLHEKKALQILKKYKNASHFMWAQEEPKNMGAYPFLAERLTALLKQAGIDKPLAYGGRSERASPSVGLEKQHISEQEKLITSVFSKKEGFEI